MLVFLLLPWAQGFLFAAIAQHQGAILLDARDLPLAVGDMAMLIDGAGKADFISLTDLDVPWLIDGEVMGGVLDVGEQPRLARCIGEGHGARLGVNGA